MAFFQYLVFDGENLPLPDSYEVELEDVEVDSGGETEAGTTQRDVVQYFDTETLGLKTAEMYVTGYKAKLRKDTSYKGLWTVSFTLKEM